MVDLVSAMSKDMGIKRYSDEPNDLYLYRLCYSALGLWCLMIARKSTYGLVGTTKHYQTLMINELIQRYGEVLPQIIDKFSIEIKSQVSFSVHIRRIYEETGYLLTDNQNRNCLADYGRNISVGNKLLYVGIPNQPFTVNGLGITTDSAIITSSSICEFLIRDKLNCEEYFFNMYDEIDFYERDLPSNDLQFFNPLSKTAPSQSWSSKLYTDYSIARKSELGPYYRVIKEYDGTMRFADEISEIQNDRLTDYEYRRLYFALKAHYNNRLVAKITKIDQSYSRLRLSGHLPNREYYFLLLVSWPLNHIYDKTNLIIGNELIEGVKDMLNNIGIDVQGGNRE